MTEQEQLDQLSVNTIRTLSIDAVQKARSGHPGTPMDAAPTVYCLWQRFLRYDPEDPTWPNRDRFVLSNGHASAMLYSLLYLAAVKAANPTYEQVGRPAVMLDDLKHFRQADIGVVRPADDAARLLGRVVDACLLGVHIGAVDDGDARHAMPPVWI